MQQEESIVGRDQGSPPFRIRSLWRNGNIEDPVNSFVSRNVIQHRMVGSGEGISRNQTATPHDYAIRVDSYPVN